MNCEPCKSLEVTCNHNVTIGYLKELVSIIPNACCTTITVSGNDDYCPTYGELMGGSIIPSFVDGGNYSWSNNVDGIVINGGYSSNQCVAKKDLKLIYTAFEDLTVSNSSPVVSECSGATTTIRTLTFRKYVKECDSTPTSTVQEDSTLRVTWSGTDGSNTGTKTYNRNTSFSDTHPSTVYCSISWRGCSHTSSNSVTVSQNVRRFDHYDDYSRSSGESVSVTCYPITINCEETTSEATATYYYTSWTERHSIDTCGYDYDQHNINISYENPYDIRDYLNAQSHTFPACSEDGSYFEFTASYDGFSDSAVATVDCVCDTCPPTDHIEYTAVTRNCTKGYAKVSGTLYTYTGGELDASGNCINYEEHSAPVSYRIDWDCNTQGGWIDQYVYVTGAPCCSGEEFVYDDVEVDCVSADSRTMSVGYIQYHTNPDGSITEIPGTNPDTPIPAVPCNPTSSPRDRQSRIISDTLATSRPKVIQRGGPCCPEGDVFEFDEVFVECEAAGETSQTINYTQTHTNPDGTTTTTTGTDTRTIPAVECNPDSATRPIREGNTATTLSEANPKITQKAGPCCTTPCTPSSCTCYMVSTATAATVPATSTTTSVTWAYSAITWTTASTCDVTSSKTEGTSSTTVTYPAATCAKYKQDGTITWTNYKVCGDKTCSSNDVTIPWEVNQEKPAGCDCSCDDMKFNNSVSFAPEDGDSTIKVNVVTQTASCIDCNNITYNSLQNFTVQKSGCDIYVYPNQPNTARTAITETLTISYTADSSSCSSAITLTHLGTDCNCNSIKSRIELYNYGDPTPVVIPAGVVTASTTVVCPLSSRFVLAKADVQDCGKVHADTNDIQFFDGGVGFDESTNEVYCNGILSQGYTVGTYFIDTKSAEKECTRITVRVECGSAACTCSDISKLELEDDLSSLDCDMEGTTDLFDPWSISSCLTINITSTPEWANGNGNSFWLCPNTGDTRSGDIGYEVIHRTDSTTCVTSSVTITQYGNCPSCTCRNMPLAKRRDAEEVDVSERGGQETLWFVPDGDIPFTCQFEAGTCETSSTERVTIIPRITYYDPSGTGRQWITGTTTGSSYGDQYYIEIYFEGTNTNRVANVWADFAIDGSKCSNSSESYAVTQHVEDNCPCESAVTWFDGSSEPIKEVSYSTTSVTWNLNADYYCRSQYSLEVTDYISCIDFDITGTSTSTSVTARFTENYDTQERECNFAKVRLIRNAGQSTSAICDTYTLGVKQLPCDCSAYDMDYSYENGFSDCEGNYGYDDRAWYAQNSGTSRTIASIKVPSASCISVTCDVTSWDDSSLQYFDASLYTFGSKYEIIGQVKNGANPPSSTAMTYNIALTVKNGTTECTTKSKTISFTLYKNCPCSDRKCNNYNLSSNLVEVTTSITTTDFTEVAKLTTLPTDSCLKVEAEVQDPNVSIEWRGNSIYVKGFRSSSALTLNIRLYYYDTNRGDWYMCSGGEENISLTVN